MSPWKFDILDQVFKNPFKDVLEEMAKPKEEKARSVRFFDADNFAEIFGGLREFRHGVGGK